MMTSDKVIATMLAGVTRLAPIDQPLAACSGCLLASPVVAPADLPPLSLACRDGFALRMADVSNVPETFPIRLPVIGEIAAGDPVPDAPPARGAFRVMTGAPLPPGFDVVVPKEHCKFQPASNCLGTVEMMSPFAAGQFVASPGSEFAAGAQVLAQGQTLGPAELAALAALGLARAAVIPRPRVALVITGTELRRQNSDLALSNLYASNEVLVTAMVHACGGVVESVRIVSDDFGELTNAMLQSMCADLILTTGGTGKGSRDLIGNVMSEREVTSLWNLPVQSSRPTTFRLLRLDVGGRIVPHLALPGRSAAAMLAFSLFVDPLLRRLSGRPLRQAPYRMARVAAVPEYFHQSQRFFPVRLLRRERGWQAIPTGDISLYGLSSSIGAHGFALLGDACNRPVVGEVLRVLVHPWVDR